MRQYTITFSKANDRQGLALDFDADEFTSLPLSFFETRTAFGNFPRHGHHQCNCMFGCGANVARRRVDDNNSQLGSFLDI